MAGPHFLLAALAGTALPFSIYPWKSPARNSTHKPIGTLALEDSRAAPASWCTPESSMGLSGDRDLWLLMVDGFVFE